MQNDQRTFEQKLIIWIILGIIAAITIPSLGTPPLPPLVFLFGFWGGVLTAVIFIGGLFLGLWYWHIQTNTNQNH